MILFVRFLGELERTFLVLKEEIAIDRSQQYSQDMAFAGATNNNLPPVVSDPVVAPVQPSSGMAKEDGQRGLKRVPSTETQGTPSKKR